MAGDKAGESQEAVVRDGRLQCPVSINGKEVDEFQAKNLTTVQEFVSVQGRLDWFEQTQKYSMATGISKVVVKCQPVMNLDN